MEWKRSSFCSSGGCVEMSWSKSSASTASACVEVAWRSCGGGECVEVGRRTATASGGNGCVEVDCRCQDGKVYVRDSKLGKHSPVLGFTPSGWRGFLRAAEEWDRASCVAVDGVLLEVAGAEPPLAATILGPLAGDFPVRITSTEGILRFSWEEWDAFVKGVGAGEFEMAA